VKEAALSQFPRCYQNNTHHSGNPTKVRTMLMLLLLLLLPRLLLRLLVLTLPAKPGDENNHTVQWETMSDCHWTDRDYLDFMGYKMRTVNWSVDHLWQRCCEVLKQSLLLIPLVTPRCNLGL